MAKKAIATAGQFPRRVGQSQEVAVRAWGGLEVSLKRLSSGAVLEIERSFPHHADGRIVDFDGYMRALIVACVHGADGPLFKSADQVRDEVDMGALGEIWDHVARYLGLRKEEPEKN